MGALAESVSNAQRERDGLEVNAARAACPGGPKGKSAAPIWPGAEARERENGAKGEGVEDIGECKMTGKAMTRHALPSAVADPSFGVSPNVRASGCREQAWRRVTRASWSAVFAVGDGGRRGRLRYVGRRKRERLQSVTRNAGPPGGRALPARLRPRLAKEWQSRRWPLPSTRTLRGTGRGRLSRRRRAGCRA